MLINSTLQGLEQFAVFNWSRNSSLLYYARWSLTCSQKPTTVFYSLPVHITTYFSMVHVNIILSTTAHYTCFPIRFPNQNVVNISCFISTTCPVHLILPDLISLIIMMGKMSDIHYVICSILSLPYLGPNILDNISSKCPNLFLWHSVVLLWGGVPRIASFLSQNNLFIYEVQVLSNIVHAQKV